MIQDSRCRIQDIIIRHPVSCICFSPCLCVSVFILNKGFFIERNWINKKRQRDITVTMTPESSLTLREYHFGMNTYYSLEWREIFENG